MELHHRWRRHYVPSWSSAVTIDWRIARDAAACPGDRCLHGDVSLLQAVLFPRHYLGRLAVHGPSQRVPQCRLRVHNSSGVPVRHDYGVYIGFAAVVALALTRAAVPATRHIKSILSAGGAYAVAVAIVLAPWLVVVQMHEGIVDYV